MHNGCKTSEKQSQIEVKYKFVNYIGQFDNRNELQKEKRTRLLIAF